MTVSESDAANNGSGGAVIRRHSLATRIWHWVNFVVLFIMLMSGLMIFNAHPRLYWGSYGANSDPAWFEIGNRDRKGFLRLGDFSVETTGLLGVWTDADGRAHARAFPSWATIPSYYSLGLSRRWHLTFAWAFAVASLLYLLWVLFSGHLRRDLAPKRSELRAGHIWNDVRRHAMLKFPRGDAARDYNSLQKFSYLGVLIILIPAMVLTGLTMSPAIDASFPWLLDLFGGRQSARSIHFITAMLLTLFIVAHVLMVILAGPINEMRSIITGRYRLPKEKDQ